MKLRTTLKRVYLPALLGTILLSVAFRTAALFTNFNTEIGFYDGKILINIASWLVIAGSVFMFTYAFTGSKRHKLIADFSTPATYVPTGALSVAMIFFAIATAIKSSKSSFSIRSLMLTPGLTRAEITQEISKNMASLVLSLMAPMACLAVLYFILTACVLKRSSQLRAFFGTANVLFLAFYTSYLYFDSTSSLARNAPNKIVDQMAFLFAALFFLYEIRISLGREKWNLYMAFGFIASALTAYSSIPSLLYHFISGEIVSNSAQENVLTFAIFVFITSRLTLAAFLKEEKESESVIVMKQFANARGTYIKEKEEALKKAYAELYEDINELSDDNTDGDVVQISFDESIELSESGSSEYAERELMVSDTLNVESDVDVYVPDMEAEFIQESILFPKDFELPTDALEPDTEVPVFTNEDAAEQSEVLVNEASTLLNTNSTLTAEGSTAPSSDEEGTPAADETNKSSELPDDTYQERTI